MFGKLLPKDTSFFDFFDNHSKILVQGTKELLLLVSDGANINEKACKIKELEREADQITHQCIDALHKAFITPFEREDIYRIICRMDDVMDFVEDIAGRIIVYKFPSMTLEVKDIANMLVSAALDLEQAFRGLRGSEKGNSMRKVLKNIYHLESEANVVLRNAVGKLFDEEPDTRTVVKWKEIYENLKHAIDRCEEVATILEGVILEHE